MAAVEMIVHSPIDDSDGEDDHLPAMRMSRLSIETSEGEVADGELSDVANKDTAIQFLNDDDDESPSTLVVGSLPVTAARRRRSTTRRAKEIRELGRGRGRDGRLLVEREREWERRRSREIGMMAVDQEGECRLLVRRKGRPGCISMDIDEVKACRELGIQLQPCDWTVGFSGSAPVDSSSGGDSSIPNWRISVSSPGDDPKDVKARLKMWAHAVALASSTSFST